MAGITKNELITTIKDLCGPLVAQAVEQKFAERASGQPQSITREMLQAIFGGGAQPEKTVQLAEKGLSFARCVRATAAAKMSGLGPEGAIDFLKKWGNHDLAEKWSDARTKAMAAGIAQAGGFLVPEQFSQEVIEFLRAQSVIRRLNARVIPVPQGTLKIPKLTGGATAYYVGENTNATKSELTTGQLTLTFKKLITLVPMSNDLLRYSSPGADTIVRDDVVNAIRVREDQAFIRDNGTDSTPKGLRFWAHADNILEITATVNVQNTFTDLGSAILQLLNANIPMIAPAWVMAPRTEMYLKTLLNSNGYPVFRDEMMRGTLMGYPYGVTTNVPINVGVSSNKSEIYLADFAQVLIGESMALMVDTSQEAAYHDGSSVIAAYSQDQTVVRTIMEHDLGVRHDKAVAVLTQVSWKPGSV